MSRKVQLIVTMSGQRADNRPWPAAGHPLVVEDWEADHLIRGGIARPWLEPEAEPEQQQWMASTPAPDQHVPEAEVAEEDPETTPLSERTCPKPVQPKADWVAWAVASGAPEEDVRDLTKAELMERYGDRA
jgi:hypothetical protein